MAGRVPARLTASEGRKFGLTVGAAFLALAAIGWWRGGGIATNVFATLGGLLAAAGLVIPTQLGPVERGWMALAHAISKVTTPIVMGIMYLVVLTPVGFMRRALGGNPLAHPLTAGGYWKSRPEGKRRSANFDRQF